MLNAKPSNLVFLKKLFSKKEFHKIIITVTDQNGTPLKRSSNTTFYRTKTRKYVKGYGIFSFAGKYRKQLLNTGLDALKNTSNEVVHKAAEATDEFIGNKIADKIVKTKHVIDENPRNVEK